MYFNKFSHILLWTSLQLPHRGGNTGRISSSDKDFPVQATTTVRMTGFNLEKRRHPRAAEDSLQKAKATL
ncbi:Hypothetical protein FKW44_009886, partial [Caligus rogercresseyi]